MCFREVKNFTLTGDVIYLSKEVILLYIKYGTIKVINGKMISIEGDEIKYESEKDK